MNKKLFKTYKAIITNKYLPDVLNDEQYLEEENVDVIGLNLKVDGKEIKLIKDRNSQYSDLFVGDEVILNEYTCLYDYDGYLFELKNMIDRMYSAYPENKRKLLYDKFYITEEEYKKHPKFIVNYEIDFNVIN